MGRLTLKLLLLFIPIILVSILFVNLSSHFIKMVKGPTTKEQIEISFKNALKRKYDALVLGNSRIYRGINPDKLTFSQSFNFAHDNDSYNQCYHKLKYLHEHKVHVKYLLLGVDYFQFSFLSDTRNYVYKDIFSSDYIKDYNITQGGSLLTWDFKRLNSEFNNFMTLNFTQKTLPFIDGLKMSITKPKDFHVPYLKENGQYINPGKGQEEDIIKRNYSILPIQRRYFDEIFKFCDENNITIIMIMPPVRKSEMQSFPDSIINKFDRIFVEKTKLSNHKYLSYRNDVRFSLKDFKDATHLNPQGAEKFTVILNEDIKRSLNE